MGYCSEAPSPTVTAPTCEELGRLSGSCTSEGSSRSPTRSSCGSVDTCESEEIEELCCGSSVLDSGVSTAAFSLEQPEDSPSTGSVRIICVGVMRTGLQTLHRALRNLGHSNIYDQDEIVSTYELWDQVLRDKATKDTFSTIFRGAEVIMGMPTFCFWEQIVELYPNARVILTVRDEDSWWESVRHAESLMDKDLPGAPLRYGSAMRRLERFLVPSYHKFCEVLRFAWATTLGAHALQDEGVNETVARSSYRKHNSYVKAVLGNETIDNGAPKLLVYDVRDGWGPLCRFLGLEEPEVEFPSMFQVRYFPGPPPDGGAKGSACFEDMVLPESEFGVRMRQELRWGLLKGAMALTLLLSVVSAVLFTRSAKVPLVALGLGQLVIIAVGWNVYVVMHGLVLRVPALVVLPMAMKSLLIAGVLQACLISYGVLKEMLVTQDRVASPLLVLSSRFGAIICSAALMLLTEGRVGFNAPLHSMAAFAFTNEASTWAGYEMLKYVSFPVQVMAKSVKMLPSMLMGRALCGTQYSTYQYVQALVALVCVAIMSFSDMGGHSADEAGQGGAEDWQVGPRYRLAMGISVLAVFFVCDSFTSQWQNSLYRKHQALTQTQMMLGGNLLGFLLTCGTLFAQWSKVQESIALAMQRPEVMGRVACLGIVYALSQFCIYSAIRILGPLSFNWIMTGRQLLSVLISLVFFGHGISATKVACILVVFGIMSAKQLQKAVPKLTHHALQIKRAVSQHSLRGRLLPQSQGAWGPCLARRASGASAARHKRAE